MAKWNSRNPRYKTSESGWLKDLFSRVGRVLGGAKRAPKAAKPKPSGSGDEGLVAAVGDPAEEAREAARPPDYASMLERLRDPDQSELYRSLEKKIQAQSGQGGQSDQPDRPDQPGQVNQAGASARAAQTASLQAVPAVPARDATGGPPEEPLELASLGEGVAETVDLAGLDEDKDPSGAASPGTSILAAPLKAAAPPASAGQAAASRTAIPQTATSQTATNQTALDNGTASPEATAKAGKKGRAKPESAKPGTAKSGLTASGVVELDLAKSDSVQASAAKDGPSQSGASAAAGKGSRGASGGSGSGGAGFGGPGGGSGFKLLRPFLVAVIVVAAVAGGWLYLTRPRPEPPAPAPETAAVEEAPAPALPTAMAVEPELPPGPMGLDRAWRQGLTVDTFTIESGGTISHALGSLSLSQAQRHALYQLFEREGLLAQVKPGEQFQAWWSDPSRSEDSLERLEFRSRPEDRPLVFLPGGPDGFVHFNAAAPPKKIHQATQGSVIDSFWVAAERAGLEPWVILHIVDLMASQVDFVSDIRTGDDFQLLFLGEYQEGRLVAKPVIEMIRMTNNGRRYEFYRHVGDDQVEGYYDVQFRSIHKHFFKSPLQYSRISSGFTHARRHPILKIVRPHLGVDYAAPEGTPVSAVADGVVVSAGFRGDYGRLVVLDHDGEYRTMYGHLSRIAKGLAPGVKVAQGDLVGNVGMSGLATGPHLDFRLIHKGQFVDPEKELSAQEGKPLPPEERTRFAEAVTQDQALLRQILDGS